MRLSKLFKFAKKGAKAAAKHRGKAAPAGGFEWPSGVRVGVFGHANSGKTVYFTVLNEECKVAKNLQISVTDSATAGDFLTNYRRIWGVGAATGVGTVVDLREEKKFPDPTSVDRVLQFKAIIDRTKKVPIVAYDYDGKAVSISEGHQLADKVFDFMSVCDGILFFFDPKVLGAELQTQAHVASFVNMLERLAPLHRRLPIPVALVVTKADVLPGFTSENQTILISGEDEHMLADDYELFLEKVLASPKIAANAAWAGTVRDALVKLRDLLRVVVTRTLNFQIFFISSTGQPPERIGTEVGRSVYAPPARMTPIGVREPFYWLLKAIARSRGIRRVRTLARVVAVLGLLWIALCSFPYLYHFKVLLPAATQAEDNILESYSGNRLRASNDEKARIIRAYNSYERSLTTKWFFPRYLVPAGQIRAIYSRAHTNVATDELNRLIDQMTTVVRERSLWPAFNPANDSLILSETHRQIETDLKSYRTGDETSPVYARADRVLTLWELFKTAILTPADTTPWGKVAEQINYDTKLHAKEQSKEEIALTGALTDAVLGRMQQKAKAETAQKAGSELDDLMSQINANPDRKYRVGDAVDKLKSIKAALQDNPARQQDIQRIDEYLSQAEYFNKPQTYHFVLTSCPPDHHIHIMVRKGGKGGVWPKGEQLLMGDKFTLEWKSGDHVLIGIDEKHVNKPESWGESPKDLKELKDRLSLFDMDGTLTFPGGQSIGIGCEDDLDSKLPKF
ncbi:MAG TPA: GTPase domain-containing protein [Candidatus Deferrimicrobium sp.]|nr:GTPase domain-containing protein [Candidatus Deferrimicrobium sp.]